MSFLKRKYFLVIFLFLSGCVFQKRTFIGDITELPRLENKERICLAEAITKQVTELKTFRGLLDLTISTDSSKYNLRQVVIFERPENVRIELFQPGLNQIGSLIVIRNGELIAYSTNKRIGYRGQANAENISRLIGIPLSGEELMLWLSGRVFKEIKPGVAVYRDLEQNKYIIREKEGKRETVIALVGEKDNICLGGKLKIVAAEIREQEKTLFSSEYGFVDDQQEGIKEKINFEIEQVNLSGEIIFRHRAENFSLKDKKEKLFYFSFPVSAQIRQIEDIGEDSFILPLSNN